MPCSDGRESWRVADPDPKLRLEIDGLTALLCEACQILTNRCVIGSASSGLKSWYKEHKRIDQIRLDKETALAKLTLVERKLLGLQ